MSLLVVKEIGANFLVEMSEYFAKNPQIIVNGFVKSGISTALEGGYEEETCQVIENSESEDDFFI